MTTRSNGAAQCDPNLVSAPNLRPLAARLLAKLPARAVLTTAQHALTVCGVSAVALIALLFARPDLARQLTKGWHDAPTAAVTTAATPAPAEPAPQKPAASALAAVPVAAAPDKAQLGSRKEQQWVTSWLSKRYRVAGDAANMLVATAYVTAREIKLDPLLILAVMAIESGLNPFAESPVGAQGLMQVMSKVHHDKFQDLGGVQAALNPVANIRVGSQILKDYVTRGGSIEAGLKTYVGAAAFATDNGYGSRVLAEYRRLKQVSTGQNVPAVRVPTLAAAPSAPSVPVSVKMIKNDEIAGL